MRKGDKNVLCLVHLYTSDAGQIVLKGPQSEA